MRNIFQQDLYSNGIYGFYVSPTGKGFLGGLTLFCEKYYFTKKITNLQRKNRVKVQKGGVKVQKSGVKVDITNL